jgi:branched-chain amino acid transport system substrate-binding protein
MTIKLRGAAAGLAFLGSIGAAQAQISDGVVKVGVLTDLSGIYSQIAGEGSVAAARLAIDDCLKAECTGMKIELLSADHQNKADIASSKAREWLDVQKVDALVDNVNASVQLAIHTLVKEVNSVALTPGGTSRLTNENCAPENAVQWMWDTYSQVAGVAEALTTPGSTWYFLTADYAFGHQLEKDATAIIQAKGGKIQGALRHPFNNADFSSFLLQAQASGANVIALANAGADSTNSIKQAKEFGFGDKQKMVAFLLMLPDIHALGLDVAKNTILTEGFYWDVDDGTRAFSKRFEAIYKKGKPSQIHAGVYSSVRHYLKAVAFGKTDNPKAVIRKMHELPISDDVVRNPRLRPDGRMVHDTYLLRVKTPAESKGPYDYYQVLEVIPGDKAFKPLKDSLCADLKK